MQQRRNIRQELLFTVQTILDQQGLAALTTKALVTRLAISKRTLYQHFSTKEALVSAVIANKLAELAQMEKETYQISQPAVLPQIRQLLLLYCQIVSPFHKMSLEDVKRYYPNLWKKADEFRQEKWQTIAELLHKEISQGHIRLVHPDILELIIRKSLQELLRAPPLPKEIHFVAINHLIDILLTGMISRTPLPINQLPDTRLTI